ncbi:MAG: hypothetical protein A2857_01515 [Candidatus Levybacteria bacterium RIFCSPHIGHO2_01_FULL_36_15]|nr:MAG: hypothetical protein A2857_01515 [Candidatus Levybacteria bacterium RIFCSPHIGHO2_01_FULL_36_15]OGH39273.1 MAG: hypothetical protein A2905_00215 [Candidatus Levybacteria bacterium RIFCSPLOWO2_01_FULL_36_10]
MFNPLKGIGDKGKLIAEALKVKRELQKIETTGQKGDVVVVVSGEMKLKSVKVSGEDRNDIKDAVNEALEKAQKQAAAKMQEVGGGLQGLLRG